mmetsp:Transcript_19663/g.74380  ORF Transcript_19663/g.74380 Transcript_19663/m.74380 type:complete len:259 (-) Transcript_19663:332-1108(-)
MDKEPVNIISVRCNPHISRSKSVFKHSRAQPIFFCCRSFSWGLWAFRFLDCLRLFLSIIFPFLLLFIDEDRSDASSLRHTLLRESFLNPRISPHYHLIQVSAASLYKAPRASFCTLQSSPGATCKALKIARKKRPTILFPCLGLKSTREMLPCSRALPKVLPDLRLNPCLHCFLLGMALLLFVQMSFPFFAELDGPVPQLLQFDGDFLDIFEELRACEREENATGILLQQLSSLFQISLYKLLEFSANLLDPCIVFVR